MLLKIGAVLLVVWLVAVLLLEDQGNIRHVPLFLGLMLVLLGFLKARDAAVAAARDASHSTRKV
jgi:hypothetical protein